MVRIRIKIEPNCQPTEIMGIELPFGKIGEVLKGKCMEGYLGEANFYCPREHAPIWTLNDTLCSKIRDNFRN